MTAGVLNGSFTWRSGVWLTSGGAVQVFCAFCDPRFGSGRLGVDRQGMGGPEVPVPLQEDGHCQGAAINDDSDLGADLLQFREADVAELRESESKVAETEQGVLIVWVHGVDEPGGRTGGIEDLDYRRLLAPPGPVGLEFFSALRGSASCPSAERISVGLPAPAVGDFRVLAPALLLRVPLFRVPPLFRVAGRVTWKVAGRVTGRVPWRVAGRVTGRVPWRVAGHRIAVGAGSCAFGRGWPRPGRP